MKLLVLMYIVHSCGKFLGIISNINKIFFGLKAKENNMV